MEQVRITKETGLLVYDAACGAGNLTVFLLVPRSQYPALISVAESSSAAGLCNRRSSSGESVPLQSCSSSFSFSLSISEGYRSKTGRVRGARVQGLSSICVSSVARRTRTSASTFSRCRRSAGTDTDTDTDTDAPPGGSSEFSFSVKAATCSLSSFNSLAIRGRRLI
jgi:hypothetical protein